MGVKINPEKCTGCGSCYLSCPEDAVDRINSFVTQVNTKRCTLCLVCMDYCPNQALEEI